MPTIITHGVTAYLIGKALIRKKAHFRFWFWSAICSMLPDADVIGFLFGVKYGDFWGHRGFTHSLFFAFILSIVISILFAKKLDPIKNGRSFWIVYFFLIIGSHGIFDGFTDGGLGIAYFSPFDNNRYFMPWTPVLVSPIGVHGILSERGVRLFVSEFTHIVLPLIPVTVLSLICSKLLTKKT